MIGVRTWREGGGGCKEGEGWRHTASWLTVMLLMYNRPWVSLSRKRDKRTLVWKLTSAVAIDSFPFPAGKVIIRRNELV